MNLQRAIEGYLFAARADGYSELTLRSYQSALSVLADFLEGKELASITPKDIQDFMYYLRTDYRPKRPSGSLEPLSSASHHRYWKAIRSFFKWAGKELGAPRPEAEIRMPRYTSREIVPFSEDELQRLLRACDIIDAETKAGRSYTIRPSMRFRNRALLLLLLDTGLRVGEFCRLQVRDANLETGEVYVRPHHVRKTRPRTVLLGKTTRKALWRYLTEREEMRPGDALFANQKDGPLTPHALQLFMDRLGTRASVNDVHPHRFRHTFAIQYLRNGGDVFTLQRLLGHATLEMVKRYLALAEADDAEAHRRASPADRWRL